MPQGLPKFLSNSFVEAGSNGLGHALLSPARVNTTLPSGTQVTLSCNTTYPFGNILRYTFTASAPFTLNLRVPSWVTIYEIIISSYSGSSPKTYDIVGLVLGLLWWVECVWVCTVDNPERKENKCIQIVVF